MSSKNVDMLSQSIGYRITTLISRNLTARIVRYIRRRREKEMWEKSEKRKASKLKQVMFKQSDGTATRGYQPKPWPGLKKYPKSLW